MVKKLNKKADTSLPFTWIFALILIVAFILAAMYGINSFLRFGTCSQIGLGMENFQKRVNDAYQSSSSDIEITIQIPAVEKICFMNFSKPVTGDLDVYQEISIYEFQDANTFLYPTGKACDMAYKKIKYLDLETTTVTSNPMCFDFVKGETTVRLKKELYARAVAVK